MRFLPTAIPGVTLVEPDVFRDARGFLLESYQAARYREGGVDLPFVQDNHSHSTRAVLRGLHGQHRRQQGKLVRVLRGEVFDVAVDVRRGSPTFARWVGVVLSEDNFRQLYVPPGFLHGFCVTSAAADVEYKCTDFYDGDDQIAVRWDDPALAIEWPIANPVLSENDRTAPLLAEIVDRLPAFRAPA